MKKKTRKKFRDMTAVEKAEFLNDKFFEIDGRLYHQDPTGIGGKTLGPVGSDNGKGYLQVSIDGKLERAHRIVFAMHNGYWPENFVDHVYDIRGNNRIENLQEASPSCNRSKTEYRGGESGFRGIYKHGRGWHAKMQKRGRQYYSRTCPTRLDALWEWVSLLYKLFDFEACQAPAFQHNLDIIECDERLLGLK